VWAVRGSYRIGETSFGVRSTSKEFGEWLGSALGGYKQEEDAQTRYSVVIADGADGSLAKERYHILYKGTVAVVKTTSLQTLVGTLFSELELLFEDREDAMHADLIPVSLGGVTALVPTILVPFIGTLGRRRVARSGLSIPLDVSVAIDPVTAEIVPVRPNLQTPAGSLEALAELQATDGAGDRVPLDGPAKVDALISIGWGEEPVVPVTGGLALYRLASHVLNLWKFGEEGLLTLKGLVERTRSYEMASKKPPEMLDALLGILRST
jgi:hypothetical protein